MRSFPTAALSLCTALTAAAQAQQAGLNILLNQPPTPALLASLSGFGTVLDVIPEINAVTMRGDVSQLAAIRGLPCVTGANADQPRSSLASRRTRPNNLGAGANQWSLDAVNVTDFGTGRTVEYDGRGVYVAVLDTGSRATGVRTSPRTGSPFGSRGPSPGAAAPGPGSRASPMYGNATPSPTARP
jgi:hypothetical protein